ncbi:response regulator [Sphingomonas sp. ASV193]|uniref:response regulator n=1 Tax=Sphingomonas sp. ASV193 TaxID=3144405 RepID=UPI0032E91C9B
MGAVATAERASVLVVEDHPMTCRMMREAVLRAGYRPVIANDGCEAIERVRDAQSDEDGYALVLMDLAMPRMDGFEASRRIRSLGLDGHRLPIVAITATGSSEAECRAAGMQAAVAKPVAIDTMRALLDHWTPRSAAGRADRTAPERRLSDDKETLARLLLLVIDEHEVAPLWGHEIADALRRVAGSAAASGDSALARTAGELERRFVVADDSIALLMAACAAIRRLLPLGLDFHGKLEGKSLWPGSS